MAGFDEADDDNNNDDFFALSQTVAEQITRKKAETKADHKTKSTNMAAMYRFVELKLFTQQMGGKWWKFIDIQLFQQIINWNRSHSNCS